MNRLFVFGCSFTYYIWPTWADFLAEEYEHYENWGISGIGNRAIFNRLIEFSTTHKITKDDTVIIQWSSHLRNDFYTPNKIDDYRNLNWKTYGSLFNYHNQNLYGSKWIKTFFHEPAYLYETLNYISAAQQLLENTNCNWFMTSMGDIQKLNTDLPQIIIGYENEDSSNKIFDEFTNYIKPIFEDKKSNWIVPIGSFCNREEDYWNINGIDPHPHPFAQVRWLNENLMPKLNKQPSINQELWLQSINDAKEKAGNNKKLFEHILFSEHDTLKYWPNNVWPGPYYGY
tara:strand:- start:379 stop:1236 length:858 start_codon:yes stop_codon:yes gene_type:complete